MVWRREWRERLTLGTQLRTGFVATKCCTEELLWVERIEEDFRKQERQLKEVGERRGRGGSGAAECWSRVVQSLVIGKI